LLSLFRRLVVVVGVVVVVVVLVFRLVWAGGPGGVNSREAEETG
jgi:hypothetical protein